MSKHINPITVGEEMSLREDSMRLLPSVLKLAIVEKLGAYQLLFFKVLSG